MKDIMIKVAFLKVLCIVLVLCLACLLPVVGQSVSQWRGPDRNGVFPETDLLKSWPESGPVVLWIKDDIDRGFSSVSVAEDVIYVTGVDGTTEYLSALDKTGKLLWRKSYGSCGRSSYKETRSTPTVQGDRIYLISGSGEVVCINAKRKRVRWSVPAFDRYGGESWQWGLAESPLLVDDKVIYTYPPGSITSFPALSQTWMVSQTPWSPIAEQSQFQL